MCLGYHITEAYLVPVIPSAGLHEIIQQPLLFAFRGLLCRVTLIFLKVACQQILWIVAQMWSDVFPSP